MGEAAGSPIQDNTDGKEQRLLQPLTNLPEGVIGFQADRKLTADDYKQIVIPTIEKQLATGEDIRIVLVFERFEGLTADAAWET